MQRTFQQIFKELRQEKGLTQAQLAERLNYTQGNISGWEKGSVEPKATALIAIAEFFGVTIEYLLGVTDEFNIPLTVYADEGYTVEERKLIDDFRKLSYYRQELIKNNIKAMLPVEAESVQKKKG